MSDYRAQAREALMNIIGKRPQGMASYPSYDDRLRAIGLLLDDLRAEKFESLNDQGRCPL